MKQTVQRAFLLFVLTATLAACGNACSKEDDGPRSTKDLPPPTSLSNKVERSGGQKMLINPAPSK
jgi:hypothetical protein